MYVKRSLFLINICSLKDGTLAVENVLHLHDDAPTYEN